MRSASRGASSASGRDETAERSPRARKRPGAEALAPVIRYGTRVQPLVLRVSRRRLFAGVLFGWLGIDLLALLLDLTVNFGKLTTSSALRRLVDITREDAIGTWVSTTQLVFLAGVLVLVRLQRPVEAETRSAPWMWTALAAFFAYMSIDDGSKMHERVGTAFESATAAVGFPSYTWQLIYAPFFGLAALLLLWIVYRELGVTRMAGWLVLTGLACYVVAVGLDFLDGYAQLHAQWAQDSGLDDPSLAHLLRALEEFLELAGTSLMAGGFTRFLLHRIPALHLDLDPPGTT